MGNSSGRSFWTPSKLFKRESQNQDSKKKKKKKIKARRVNSAPPEAPTYDTVADVPLYSVVDKSRKRKIIPDDNVQYAEIEVVRQPHRNRSEKNPTSWPTSTETTEYATINFPPQENHTRRNVPVKPSSSGQHRSTSSRHKPSRGYNAVNGTLV